MVQRLIDVGLKKDASAIADVHKLLSTLREGWSQAAVQPAQAPLAQAVGAR
jgi:flagellin-specific chaperone FliS